jgi:hypothetical protein
MEHLVIETTTVLIVIFTWGCVLSGKIWATSKELKNATEALKASTKALNEERERLIAFRSTMKASVARLYVAFNSLYEIKSLDGFAGTDSKLYPPSGFDEL